MKDVKSRSRYRLGRVAAGPVSFVQDGDRVTRTDDGHVFGNETYRTMMRVGWVPEVL